MENERKEMQKSPHAIPQSDAARVAVESYKNKTPVRNSWRLFGNQSSDFSKTISFAKKHLSLRGHSGIAAMRWLIRAFGFQTNAVYTTRAAAEMILDIREADDGWEAMIHGRRHREWRGTTLRTQIQEP